MATMSMRQSDRAELWERLALVGRVVKLQRIITWTVRLLLVGLLVDCLWLAGSRVLPYIVPTSILPAIPLALAALGALTLVFWRPSMSQLALQADRQLGLKERLTTAVELQGRPVGAVREPPQDEGKADPAPTALAGLQLQDAVSHFRRVEPLEAFPIRVPYRELYAVVALAALAVVLVVLPNAMEGTVRQREQIQQSIKQEAERLNKLADQIAAANFENPSEELQQIEQTLRDGANALEQRSLSGEEALAALAAMEQRLQALQGQGAGDVEEALSSLAGSMAQDPNTRPVGTSLARGEYKQAAEELRQLGPKTEQMSPAERSRLARSMRQAGQRASRGNPALGQSLSQSANALEQGSTGESQNALDNAAGQLERAEGQLRAGSERERAMAQSQQSRGSISRSVQQQQAQNRGQGQGQGQGQAGSRQEGGQAGGGEPGDDGTNGAGQQGSGGEGDQGNGDRPGGSAAGSGSNPNSRSDEIYDPGFASGRQEQLNQGQPFDPTEAFENPNLEDAQRNDPQVGYRQVYTRYQEKAVQSLENSYIPIGMKDLVKDYFSSLQPEK